MAAGAGALRLFTIPAGVDFLECFVQSLLAGRIIPDFPPVDDPISLATARIYVPTQRAARALASELARQTDTGATFLPQILPLGALAEAQPEGIFEEAATVGQGGFFNLESVPELERRLTLSHLILQWGKAVRRAICYVDENGRFVTDDKEPFLVAHAPGQAFHLAGELADLIDEMIVEGIEPDRLRTLVPEEFDRYWSITLEFLNIALQHWPEYLHHSGRVDRSASYVRFVDAEVRRLRAQPPTTPWIVAGSTGTNPATSRLIDAISRLPNGAVVLPGLDQELDAASWKMLASPAHLQHELSGEGLSGHPQAALARLLQRLGAERAQVRALAAPKAPIADRIAFLSQALRPAQTTDRWAIYRLKAPTLGPALDDVAIIEADNERLEAIAIAIAMRGALETPGKTAALITPDRRLTQRVRCELGRWGIDVEDSGGEGLDGLPAGVFARLALTLSARPDAAALIDLLHHPFTRLGYRADEFPRLARLTTVGVAHGPMFDWERVDDAVEAARCAAEERGAHRARAAIAEQDWLQIGEVMKRLRTALAPLREFASTASPQAWFDAHRQTLDQIRAPFEVARSGEPRSSAAAPPSEADLATADDIALERLFDAFAATPEVALDLDLSSYTALFETLAGETRVRAGSQTHPRLKILGLLEARLMPADLKILAGLDETVWPPAAQVGAFLNRPMRQALGLGLPERRIGQTAHDFVEAMGTREVLITRLRKRNGAPTIASRFIQRIAALAGDEWDGCVRRGQELLQLAQAIDRPALVQPVDRPRPKPPLALRPKRLSVTQIETWRRDPYAIYARHILGLTTLDEAGAIGGAADIGSRLHKVIADFDKLRQRGDVDGDGVDQMAALATQTFGDLNENIAFKTFYWPRIMVSLNAFAIWDAKQRRGSHLVATETPGRLDIDLVDGSTFTLTARADRIELGGDGMAVVVDYKSGVVPSTSQIEAGFAPQMTLEAVMVERGAFPDFPRGTPVRAALYLKLMGPQGLEQRPVGQGKSLSPLQELGAEHFRGLVDLANQFRNPDTPYVARPFPQFINRFGEYDHLARVKEWIAESSGGEE